MPLPVLQIAFDGEMGKQQGVLEYKPMLRRAGVKQTPCSVSNSVRSFSRTLPCCGRNTPAMIESTLVLPLPDGPKSEVNRWLTSQEMSRSKPLA